MKILIAASEGVPFCKTGGLADVVGALSQRLGGEGHDLCVFLPKYRAVEFGSLSGGMAQTLDVPVGGETLKVQLRYAQFKSVSVCFVDHPESFDRDGLYGSGGADFPDNDRRFILFCRAVMEGARTLGFKPEVIHAHDWQAALVCAYLKGPYAEDPHFRDCASLLTVHNLAYQGVFPRASLSLAGFPEEEFASEKFEFYGRVNFLKAGLVSADLITTVSPTYAREIQTQEQGCGLDGLLRARAADVQGVLNGIDSNHWDPMADSFLPKRYSPENVAEGKAACKAAFQKECGLPQRPDLPLVGVVSRFDRQKGLDLGLQALRPRLGRCQLAALGSGDPGIARQFEELSREFPQDVHLKQAFDEPFAHRVYAASDIFLMPSRFEPCGLGQMIAMRYGSLPVVARTGGLADTVFEGQGGGVPGNGFLARHDDAEDLGRALDRALASYGSPTWRDRRRGAMGSDFSWGRPVEAYLDLYRRARRKSAERAGVR